MTIMENHALVYDLLRWLRESPRPYSEVIDRWGSRCPRVTVWEDIVDEGFVSVGREVKLSPAGERWLEEYGGG